MTRTSTPLRTLLSAEISATDGSCSGLRVTGAQSRAVAKTGECSFMYRCYAPTVEQAALIGRSAELQTALDLVAAETATLVITGEAGVGKSRLVDELVARTGAPHVRVGCFQLAGESIAFTVLDRLMERLAPAPRDQSHSGASGRVRTFERWLDGLVSVGGAQQGLLVVEDVHWADESTLAFLAFVTHVAPPGRLCTVLTLRDDEALPDQVRRGINDLLHHPRARTLDLQRLPPEDALALVAAL